MTLTAHQQTVVRLIGDGLTRSEIAEHLDISESTVRKTVKKLCARFDCRAADLPLAVEKLRGPV